MVRVRAVALGAMFVLLARTTQAQQSSKDVTLTIAEESGKYVLTVPVSRLMMSIPKGELRVEEEFSTGTTPSPEPNPRYFFFADTARGLVASGWFESADGYPGIHQFWTGESAAATQGGMPEPRNISFVRIGHWDAVLYDLAEPAGKNTQIRAEWVAAGTWIDLHLSLVGDASTGELRRTLREFLLSINVTEKTL